MIEASGRTVEAKTSTEDKNTTLQLLQISYENVQTKWYSLLCGKKMKLAQAKKRNRISAEQSQKLAHCENTRE